MLELKKLTDKELLLLTAEVVLRERQITLELLRHLQEIERRQLYVELGYPTLYEFVIRELRLSEGAAYRRIQAMRLLTEVPEAADKIESGKINLCNASKIQRVLRKAPAEEKLRILGELEGKSTRETERILSQFDGKEPKEHTRWINANEVQLTFSLEKAAFSELEELQSIRAHVDVKKTYRVIVTDLIGVGQEKWNPLRRPVPPALGGQRSNSAEPPPPTSQPPSATPSGAATRASAPTKFPAPTEYAAHAIWYSSTISSRSHSAGNTHSRISGSSAPPTTAPARRRRSAPKKKRKRRIHQPSFLSRVEIEKAPPGPPVRELHDLPCRGI